MSRWLQSDHFSWLQDDDLQADPLGDLVTTSNGLSAWFVNSDRSNLNQLVAALAANRDYLGNVDYALFDEGLLDQISIRIQASDGDTPDQEINQTCHRDLLDLSVKALLRLGKLILARAEITRIPETQVKQLIHVGVSSGQIDPHRLSVHIATKIGVIPAGQP